MDFVFAVSWPAIAAGGFLIGFLIGMTGVGAGSLTTPMLISGFGVAPAVAVGTDLLFASITKVSSAWRHKRLGNIDWRILKMLVAGSLPGAAAVVAWLYLARPDTVTLAEDIRRVLALALVASAVLIALYPWFVRRAADPVVETDMTDRSMAMTVVFGVVLGALVALTSVGAGAIGVVVLSGLYPALLARRIIGTDIVHAVPLTFVAGMGHFGMGNIDFAVLAALLAGSIPGILLGSRVTGLVPDRFLRVALAMMLLYAAYVMAWR